MLVGGLALEVPAGGLSPPLTAGLLSLLPVGDAVKDDAVEDDGFFAMEGRACCGLLHPLLLLATIVICVFIAKDASLLMFWQICVLLDSAACTLPACPGYCGGGGKDMDMFDTCVGAGMFPPDDIVAATMDPAVETLAAFTLLDRMGLLCSSWSCLTMFGMHTVRGGPPSENAA